MYKSPRRGPRPRGEETHECHTEVHLGPAGEEDAGCPAGGPPSPPSPDTVPYGQVVP
jgi:hypothetical protein